MNIHTIIDFLKGAAIGAGCYILTTLANLLYAFEPIMAFLALCMLALFGDVYTAYRLNRRAAKLHPEKSNGKFTSKKFEKVLTTFCKLLFMLYLASGMDALVIQGDHFFAVRIVTLIFCVGQVWSILENESSSKDGKWAKVLQKVMIDKTTRHFDLEPGTFDAITKQNNNDDVTSNKYSV